MLRSLPSFKKILESGKLPPWVQVVHLLGSLASIAGWVVGRMPPDWTSIEWPSAWFWAWLLTLFAASWLAMTLYRAWLRETRRSEEFGKIAGEVIEHSKQTTDRLARRLLEEYVAIVSDRESASPKEAHRRMKMMTRSLLFSMHVNERTNDNPKYKACESMFSALHGETGNPDDYQEAILGLAKIYDLEGLVKRTSRLRD